IPRCSPSCSHKSFETQLRVLSETPTQPRSESLPPLLSLWSSTFGSGGSDSDRGCVENRSPRSCLYGPVHSGLMRKFILSEHVHFWESLLQILLDLRNGITLVDPQENVHSLF